jgi:predicted outer membrane protein
LANSLFSQGAFHEHAAWDHDGRNPIVRRPRFAQSNHQRGQSHPPPATLSFLQKSAAAVTSEIKLGQLAVVKASSPDVKQFGEKSVDDFGKAQQDLDKIAGDLKWIAPTI